jgi:hypothetical protein
MAMPLGEVKSKAVNHADLSYPAGREIRTKGLAGFILKNSLISIAHLQANRDR